MNQLQELKDMITSLNKEIDYVRKHIDAAKAVIAAKSNCGCSHMEFLEMENQWEPAYTCEDHLALEDAEYELAACQSMLYTTGKQLVEEEQFLALYNAGF